MNDLNYHLRITIEDSENKVFGPGPMKLLKNIEKTGSLNKAAEDMGMSYSKAWNMIKSLNATWNIDFLTSRTGGMGGGGSIITPEGRQILEAYERFYEDVSEYAASVFSKYY